MTITNAVVPFQIEHDLQQQQDLQQRLQQTRWPVRELVEDWSQGVPLATMKDLVIQWQQYNWQSLIDEINGLGSYLFTQEDNQIHFLHIRSPRADAQPLLLTHGWPGAIIEFLDVIPLLTNPTTDESAFHLVIPSIPGYGFSTKPNSIGWGPSKVATLWAELMASLGYDRYLAQGGDWGSEISLALAEQFPNNCMGAHINLVAVPPPAAVLENPNESEIAGLRAAQYFQDQGSGYYKLQSTRPQTVGYALTDSPVGQLAWITEKFWDWSDRKGSGDVAISSKRILDIVSWYWYSASAVSSARLYWEFSRQQPIAEINAPVACSLFPHEITKPSKRWAEARLKNIVYWGDDIRAGGHFAALEQPELFAREVRAAALALSGGKLAEA